MASIISDPNCRKRIQIVGNDGNRRTIRLGRATMRQAEGVKGRVEQLALAATGASGLVDSDTITWLSGLDDVMYGRLAAVGLVQPRVSTTLGAFLNGYLDGRQDLKPNSQLVYGHTRRTLVECLGAATPLRSITQADAERWRQYLIEQGLAEATVNKRASNAKVFLVTAGSRHSCARPPATLSVATQRSFRNSGACVNRPSALERIADVVSTTNGCASLMMARSLGSDRCG